MLRQIQDYFIGEKLIEETSFHNRTRIRLLFNIAFIVLTLGVVATLISLILGTYPILVPALGNVALGLVALGLLKYHSFKLSAAVYLPALFLLLFGNLIFNDGTMHIGSPFWIMLLNVIVIYILGKVWGIVCLSISTIIFSYYIIKVFPRTIEITQSLPPETYYSAVYETVFVLLLIGYIIFIILNASKDSDQLLTKQNDELKIQNVKISEDAEEKTVLLKEVHHRVKNNLQVIISLMRLQITELHNGEAISKYNETINRVIAMSMIHEKIYKSDSLSKINIRNYFQDLSNDLIHSFQNEKDVELIYEFELEEIGLKTIVPLALIFNELFSNSLKHAFSSIDQPVIELSLKPIDDDSFSFEYKDNGHWKERTNDASFGIELIEMLTQQLEGDVNFCSSPETKYSFNFRQLEL